MRSDLNGPNLHMLRNPRAAHLRPTTLDAIRRLRGIRCLHRHALAFHQSNHEGVLVDRSVGRNEADALIINPAPTP